MILANRQFVPEVGKIYRDQYISDDNGEIVKGTFLIIREASREEYLADLPATISPVKDNDGYRYWLVSSD